MPRLSLATEELAAPEVTAGARPTPASDIYACFFMLLSAMPLVSLPSVVVRAIEGRPEPRDTVVLAAMERVQQTALAFAPRDRPQSARAVLEDYRRIWEMLGIAPELAEFSRFAAAMAGELVDREATTRTSGAARRAAPARVIQGGRYELRNTLGRGGMGEVALAWDRQLEQHVAIKQLVHDAASVAARDRFVREVRLLRTIQHPHVVRGYDLVDDGDGVFAVMEYIEGTRLDVYFAANPARRADAAEILADVADGLASMHALGIVHRDVKPSNILMTATRGAVLVDLGVALEPGSDLTQSGYVVGSPRYMSPEQRTEGRAVATSDVYSLALVVLEAITGRSTATVAPRDLLAHDAVDEPRRRVLARCLDADPSGRPAADEFAAALRV